MTITIPAADLRHTEHLLLTAAADMHQQYGFVRIWIGGRSRVQNALSVARAEILGEIDSCATIHDLENIQVGPSQGDSDDLEASRATD